MHLGSDDSMQCFFARLDIENRTVRKEPLPTEAFAPLCVSSAQDQVLYSTRDGAAVYDVRGAIKTVATVDLKFQVAGGVFDTADHRVVLGGSGLLGWNTDTGALSRLCAKGSYPAVDGTGGVWFSYNDGTLAKLNSEAGSFDVIVALSGLETSSAYGGSYAQSVSFSPNARYALATLTGRTELIGKELGEAKAFSKQVGQPFSNFHRHRHHHFFCVLDLELQEVWCSEGFAHNAAWITKRAE